jgi:hypothetical protein
VRKLLEGPEYGERSHNKPKGEAGRLPSSSPSQGQDLLFIWVKIANPEAHSLEEDIKLECVSTSHIPQGLTGNFLV